MKYNRQRHDTQTHVRTNARTRAGTLARIQTVHLVGNDIGPAGVRGLTSVLAMNDCVLEELDLAGEFKCVPFSLLGHNSSRSQ